jgi:HTH-type transcriptional regulator, sugar sensing transcriptional regulator
MENLALQLKDAGLSGEQAAVYEALLRKGESPAREVALEAKVGRTLGYAVLDQLVAMGLAQKSKRPGSKTLFIPSHPSILEERVLSQQKAAERSALTLKSLLPDLSSMYNLATGRPGVRFYEGEAGQRETLWDSLTSTETIYTYVDVETVDAYVDDLNKAYVRERQKRGVKKQILSPDTPQARAELRELNDPLTEMRLLPEQDAPQFHTAMQIYDGKVSYLTFTNDIMTGTIINDRAIYTLHRFLFEHQWKHALEKKSLD